MNCKLSLPDLEKIFLDRRQCKLLLFIFSFLIISIFSSLLILLEHFLAGGGLLSGASSMVYARVMAFVLLFSIFLHLPPSWPSSLVIILSETTILLSLLLSSSLGGAFSSLSIVLCGILIQLFFTPARERSPLVRPSFVFAAFTLLSFLHFSLFASFSADSFAVNSLAVDSFSADRVVYLLIAPPLLVAFAVFANAMAASLDGCRRAMVEGGSSIALLTALLCVFQPQTLDLASAVLLMVLLLCTFFLGLGSKKGGRKIDICHVNLAKGFRGGERQTEMLVKALSQRGYGQRVIVRERSPLEQHLKDLPGVEVYPAMRPFALSFFLSEGCDLIHAHEAKGAHFAFHSHLIYGIPFVLTRRVLNPQRNNVYNRRLFKSSSAVICLSQAIEKNNKAIFKDSRYCLIPSMSSDIKEDEQRSRLIAQRFSGKFLLGHAGALDWRTKGQHTLIEAAKVLEAEEPDIHFLLLGSGRDETHLKNLAKNSKNVSFEGYRENIADYLAAFDLFVFPSLNEGLGSVLLDAMRFSLPIIASRRGGIPEIVEHGVTGLLFEAEDVEALVESIKDLKKNEEKRKTLAKRALERSKDYSPEEISKRHELLYAELLGHSELAGSTGALDWKT